MLHYVLKFEQTTAPLGQNGQATDTAKYAKMYHDIISVSYSLNNTVLLKFHKRYIVMYGLA